MIRFMKHFRWMFPQKMEKRTAAVFAYIWTVHFLQQIEILTGNKDSARIIGGLTL